MAHARPDVIVCDVGAVGRPDVATVDALARIALEARRQGIQLVLRHPPAALRALLGLTGLADVIPCDEPSALEAVGQTEEREEPGGVEEERDGPDA
jgi:anti-anti-sigma regulatory factor